MNFDDLAASVNHFHHGDEFEHIDEDSHDKLRPPDLDDFGLSFLDTRTKEDAHHIEEMPKITSSNVEETSNRSHVSSYRQTQRRTSSRGRRLKKGQSKRNFVTRERHVIQHNYHDHANDVIDFDEFTNDAMGLESPMKKKGGVAVPFPLKLHELLEKVEEEGHQKIVSWQPHGRAFVVREPKKFVADLMPRFFRQTKLTSFQRQLNLYGFSRLTRGPDAGGYYHELFLRGKPQLTRRMVRTKIKGTGYKAASNPACEPNFYKMSPLGPGFKSNDHGGNQIEAQTCYGLQSPITKTSYHHNVPMPVVTPDAEVPKTMQVQPNPDVFPIPQNIMGTSDSENPALSTAAPKPFLRPRLQQNIHHHHHSRAVKMGNEHFHYMESLKQPVDDTTFYPDEISGSRSCTPSPIFFEKISSEDTSVKDTDEDPSQDPLAIFLADMDGDFEDDLVFTSSDSNNNNDVQHPETEVTESQNEEDIQSNLCIFEV